MSIYENLKKHLNEDQRTNFQIGRQIGTSATQIGMLRTGITRNPGILSLQKIAELYGLEVKLVPKQQPKPWDQKTQD